MGLSSSSRYWELIMSPGASYTESKGGLHRVQLHGLDVVVDGGDLVVVRVVQSFGDTLVYQGIRREPGEPWRPETR